MLNIIAEPMECLHHLTSTSSSPNIPVKTKEKGTPWIADWNGRLMISMSLSQLVKQPPNTLILVKSPAAKQVKKAFWSHINKD